MNKFIKSFHFATDKLSDDWCKIVADQIYYHGGCVNLLQGKNVNEIEQYASGDIDMKPFIRQFKSYKRKYDTFKKDPSFEGLAKMEEVFNAFPPLPLIPVKLNSAVHLIFKVPFDIQVTATDTLADEKREKDVEFLKQRQKIQNIAQDLADQLSQGEVDVGGTKNSSQEFKKVPLDLDLNDPAELKIFLDIIYKLQPEAAYETILQLIYELKKISGPDLLEIQDDFKFGVRANRVVMSALTGVPDVEYLYPGQCFAPKSLYPDFRDNSERYIQHFPTIAELQNMFGEELKDEKIMNNILNAPKVDGGYFSCNGLQQVSSGNWGQTQVELLEIQVISMDGVHVAENKSGNKRFVQQPAEGGSSIFGQNTYVFYWLPKTKHFFGKEKLGWAYRKQGQEAFTRFPTSFYKSQKKSAVEHCVGENKKAIVASIKLHQEILQAAGPGKFIDLKFIRKATEGLLFDGKTQEEVQKDLLDLVMERNVMIGDSQGMNGINEGQMQPVRDIAGGLGNNINSYILQMQQASANISRWTGINDELAGLNSNPNTLNGARKLSITYGMNAINYAYEARLTQYRNVFEIIAWHIKDSIEKGGAARKAIEGLIGKVRTEAIDNIGTLKDHSFFIKVNMGMRQQEQQELTQSINIMETKGQLKRIERFIIDQTSNMKEANLLLAVIEHKYELKQAAAEEKRFQQQQALMQQKNEGMVQVQATSNDGKKDLTYTQGDVAAKLMQLGSQLRLSEKQIEDSVKRALQTDRLNAALIKENQRHETKIQEAQMEQVAPLI